MTGNISVIGRPGIGIGYNLPNQPTAAAQQKGDAKPNEALATSVGANVGKWCR